MYFWIHNVYVCEYVCMEEHMHAYMCVYVYIYIYTYIYVYKASPRSYRSFEIARHWADAERLRRCCCVGGCLRFILTLATSRHFQIVMSYAALSERVFSALGDFLQVEEWRIMKSNVFAWNSVSNSEKFLRRVFRCCNRVTGRTFWTVRNVTSGISVSNRSEHPSNVIPNLDDVLLERATITLRKCVLW